MAAPFGVGKAPIVANTGIRSAPVHPAFAQLTRCFMQFVAIGWKGGKGVPILHSIETEDAPKAGDVKEAPKAEDAKDAPKAA